MIQVYPKEAAKAFGLAFVGALACELVRFGFDEFRKRILDAQQSQPIADPDPREQ